jgi:hypothetical protein
MPPRPIASIRLAMFPAVNARILNNDRPGHIRTPKPRR